MRNLIGGSREDRNGREIEPVYDPATGQVIGETPLSTKEDVDRDVKAASAAFTDFAVTPVVRCIQVLFRFKVLLEEHFGELRDLVPLENGLPHVYVNQVGPGDSLTFAGGSAVVSPDGEILAQAGPTGEAVLSARVPLPARSSLREAYLNQLSSPIPSVRRVRSDARPKEGRRANDPQHSGTRFERN